MTKAIAALRFTGRRLGLAFALLVFGVLMTSCARKAALEKSMRQEMSTYAAAQRSAGGGSSDHIVTASLVSSGEVETLPARNIIRNGSLELLVGDVGLSVNRIGSIVSGIGGYVEKSTVTNSAGHAANMTIRVPSAKLDQAIAEIKRLATTVDREGVEARDVTGEYVDLDARLRNAQAEETQYLLILKRATTIKDTLDVTEKLSDVRGGIEQMQGEMKLLTSQIEMSSLEISLRA